MNQRISKTFGQCVYLNVRSYCITQEITKNTTSSVFSFLEHGIEFCMSAVSNLSIYFPLISQMAFGTFLISMETCASCFKIFYYKVWKMIKIKPTWFFLPPVQFYKKDCKIYRFIWNCWCEYPEYLVLLCRFYPTGKVRCLVLSPSGSEQ